MSSFYYVKTGENSPIECRARGRLKKDNIKPVVGDKVLIQLTSPSTGVIEEIKHRKNYLIRPNVANIDQLVLVFAAINPEPDFLLMDRLSVIAHRKNLDVLICISKIDLDNKDTVKTIEDRFHKTGFSVMGISNQTLSGFDLLKEKLKNKVSTLSGPSGAGKSTLINKLNPSYNLAVSSISVKTKRGKHTTTSCQLLEVMEDSFVVDTPGFTSLELTDISIDSLHRYFPDFRGFMTCRYTSCIHENEEECGVKKAVEQGQLSRDRYKNYLKILKEIREKGVRY